MKETLNAQKLVKTENTHKKIRLVVWTVTRALTESMGSVSLVKRDISKDGWVKNNVDLVIKWEPIFISLAQGKQRVFTVIQVARWVV